MAEQFMCVYCGHKSSNPSGSNCSHSPSKSHKWTRFEQGKKWVCAHCGHKSSNPSGSSCSKSPHKKHEWM